MDLSPSHQRYWQAYLDRLGPEQAPQDARVLAEYAGTPATTDGLIDLYLSGRKVAGSGLVEDYLSAGDPLPQVGDYWIALGADGEPRCLLRTERVETHLFHEVPGEIAVAEGEGDLSLDYWRRVHAAAYQPYLAGWGVSDIDQATVVTEFFRVVDRGESTEQTG